jgi:hypothetical protein
MIVKLSLLVLALFTATHVYLLFVAIHNTIAEYMTLHSPQQLRDALGEACAPHYPPINCLIPRQKAGSAAEISVELAISSFAHLTFKLTFARRLQLVLVGRSNGANYVQEFRLHLTYARIAVAFRLAPQASDRSSNVSMLTRRYSNSIIEMLSKRNNRFCAEIVWGKTVQR